MAKQPPETTSRKNKNWLKAIGINSQHYDELSKARKERYERYQKTFVAGTYNVVHVKTGNIRFQKLYEAKTAWPRYAIVSLMGIVMGIVILFLLKNTGLYNSGLSAIGQGISRFIYTNLQLHGNTTNAEMIFNILFWGLYFVLNVPFFIFGYLKIGKTFGLLTIVFLFFNTLTGFCLSLIPHINQILILGDTIPIGYTGNDHQNFAFAGQNVFAHYGVYILPFDFNANPGVIAGQNFLSQQIFDSDADSVRALFLLIYGIAYGLVSAVCYAMIYVVGACTAGLDFVSVYYATVKQKSLGSFLIIFNSLSMVVGASLGSYASAGLIQSQAWDWRFLFSANLIASFLSVIIFGVLVNRLYPIKKQVRVEIYSDDYKIIRRRLFSVRYLHSLTISKAVGGYSLKHKNVIVTICLYIELPKLIRVIREVDKKCMISVIDISGIDGRLSVYRQGSTE